MSWAKFDDRYDDHPKVLAATHTDPLAAALHAQAITASSRRESDGLVDPFWLISKAPNKRKREQAVQTLIELRLFDVLAAGETVMRTDAKGYTVTLGPFDEPRYLVHDYLDYNPSSTQLAERRRKDAGRKSAGNPRGVQAESKRNPSGIQGESNGIPARPRVGPRVGASAQPVPTRPDQELPAGGGLNETGESRPPQVEGSDPLKEAA